MAKGSHKRPKESKCRGSGSPVEGRDWVRIGGSKWLREAAEKQGKFIPLEYREKSGGDFVKERAERAAEAEKRLFARSAAEEAPAEAPVEEGEVEVAETETETEVAEEVVQDSAVEAEA